jgi:hypothetical protein
MSRNKHPKKHGDKVDKSRLKVYPPHPSAGINKDILSSRKHNMDYVTVDGVILRTGHTDRKMWYLLGLKEVFDNAVDFMWKYYQGSAEAFITIEITKTNDSMFHVKIRNMNDKNIPVFQDLSAIFSFDMRYGSKQNLRIISRGMLGDAMKQILAWAYVLIHTTKEGNRNGFVDRQWDKPLIIRHNGLERHVFLDVDKGNQTIHADVQTMPVKLSHTHTEIEFTWPIPDDVDLDIHEIEAYCRLYPILTTDISFMFRLVDNSKDKSTKELADSNKKFQETRNSYGEVTCWTEVEENQSGGGDGGIITGSELVKVLSSPARKAAINIEYPALHPIATGWNNLSSIHFYYPEEFTTLITSVHDKQSTSIYDIFKQSRDGTNLEKTDDNKISVAQLLLYPYKHKRIEQWYYQLRSALPPPKRLSLPYPVNDFNKRKQPIIDRIVQIYPNQLNPEKAVYKVTHGFYEGKGISYPFVFEVVAVPYDRESLKDTTESTRPHTKFFGYVNYTISPKSNKFEGKYEWYNKEGELKGASNIVELLDRMNFSFYGPNSRTRVPCIVAANLVSPRIDYDGHDKSRINTEHFTDVIIKTVKKVAEDIPTYLGIGLRMTSERKHKFELTGSDSEYTAKQLLRKFLQERIRRER